MPTATANENNNTRKMRKSNVRRKYNLVATIVAINILGIHTNSRCVCVGTECVYQLHFETFAKQNLTSGVLLLGTFQTTTFTQFTNKK